MSSLTAVVHGTGSIGLRHLGVLRDAGYERVVAVPVRGTGRGPGLDGFEVSADLPADADLVVVATDTGRHVEDALAALENGARTVLVEKPVAPTVAETRPLLAHPEAHRVRVSAPLRFRAGLIQARAWVAELERPLSVRITSQSWLPDWRPDRPFRESYSARPDEGGVLRDLVHELDYAAWLFGEPVAVMGAVSSVPSPVLDLHVDESADLLWQTSDGSAVSIRIDYVTKPARRELMVRSATGEVHWDAVRHVVRRVDGAGDPVSEVDCSVDLDPSAALRDQSSAMRGILAGEDSDLLATLTDGARAVAIGEQVRADVVGGGD